MRNSESTCCSVVGVDFTVKSTRENRALKKGRANLVLIIDF